MADPGVDRDPHPDPDRHRGQVRLLIAALVVQLLLAGLLIWGAATGFSSLRALFSTAQRSPAPIHARP